jgi:molybdenum cofactor cytidylyltransferase
MGQNKLLLRVDGEALVARAARRAAAAGLDPVLVVLGHEADRVGQELDGVVCRRVLNPDHGTGQASSFRAGVGAVPAEAPAAVVLLADMPHVTVEMIAALVARYRQTGAALVVSEYGGVHAPPTLYDRSLFDEIRGMSGDGCGRQVVRRHRGEAEVVPWPAERLADLDEPKDLEQLRAAATNETPCAPTS